MAIKFEFDSVTVAALERRLGRMKSEAPKVLAKALNQTAKDARRDLADKARQVYTVKIGGFNSQMKITNARTGLLYSCEAPCGNGLGVRLTLELFEEETDAE